MKCTHLLLSRLDALVPLALLHQHVEAFQYIHVQHLRRREKYTQEESTGAIFKMCESIKSKSNLFRFLMSLQVFLVLRVNVRLESGCGGARVRVSGNCDVHMSTSTYGGTGMNNA